MVDHSDDLRSRPDFAESSQAECPGRGNGAWAIELLRSPSLFACVVRRTLGTLAGLILVIALAGGFFAIYLGKGPIAIAGLGARITQALDERVGHGYTFTVGKVSLVSHGFGPTLSIANLSLADESGETIISAPRAEVSVDMFALLFGKVVPKRLEIFGIEMRLELMRDGSLAVSAGGGRKGAVPLLPLAAAMGRDGRSGNLTPLRPEIIPGSPTAGRSGPVNKTELAPRSLMVKRIGTALRFLIDMATKPVGPFAAIDRVGIAHGRLVIADRAADQTRVYEGLHLALDKSGSGRNFSLSAEGPNGTWSVSANASGNANGVRRLDIGVKNISIDEILLATGLRKLGVDFDMPISSTFTMALGPHGGLTQVVGEVGFGAGYLRFDDPNDEPKMIDSINTAFHWDRSTRHIKIDKLSLRAGGTNLALKGAIVPPSREGDAWQIALANNGKQVFGAERPGETPIILTQFGLGAHLVLSQKSFVIDRLAFVGPKCSFAMSGAIDWKDGPHIRLGASVGRTQSRVAVRLWPSFIVAPVRSWFLAHWMDGIIDKGALRVDFNADMIKAMRMQHAPPDNAVDMDFTISHGVVDFLPGVPPLTDISGVGHITGRTSTFTATSGRLDAGTGAPLILSDGGFHIANGEIKPTPAQISAKISGSVEAVGALLNRKALKPFASLPVDPTSLSGQIVGTLGIGLTLRPVMRPKDTLLTVDATATNLTAKNLIGKAPLEAATLNVVVNASGLTAKGQGRLFGAPANLEIDKPVGQQGHAIVSLVLDDAVRAKQGLGALSNVKGPITARLTAPLGASDPIKAAVELDLTHAAIGGLPGITKPAGRPGKASFTLTSSDKGTQIDQLVVEAAPIQARGAIDLGSDMSLISAKFSQMRFSPGDDMRVDVSKAGNGTKVVIRAAALDARPFLRNLTFAHADHSVAAPGSDKDKDKDKDSADDSSDPMVGKDMDLDLKSTILTGFNKVTLSNVDLHLVKNGDTFREFGVTGHFGRWPISGELSHPALPSPQFNLTTNDAGALLSFLDLYKHMEGGQLQVAMRLGHNAVAGALRIKNFVLRDEPALRRLVVEGVQQRPAGVGEESQPSLDPNAVAFTRLQVNFQRAGNRLDIRDGTMYGAQMGLTVDGWLDFARDQVSMDGTFVPAYAVNNLFSRIPVFGLFLGGGSHEGLFAVNYRISGAATQPTLNINPLSALAPGIFRKIFGAGDFTSPGGGSGAFETQPPR
ncbi:MAG: hypothetical protein ACYC5H_17785 [Methylovirgula sp.]